MDIEDSNEEKNHKGHQTHHSLSTHSDSAAIKINHLGPVNTLTKQESNSSSLSLTSL